MNVAAYIQQRQYGVHTRPGSKKCAQDYLESKFTESFLNKACEISGRCRSTFVMQFSPDGTKVASAHGDHSVQVSDIATGRLVRTLEGHPRTPWCLAYHPSSSHILASGCLGGQVRIWDLYGHGCEVWQTENSTVVASLAFHPIDHVLVIAAGNTIYFWDWSKPEPFATCRTKHEYERIRWVKFDSRGTALFTGICNSVTIHREPSCSTSYISTDDRRSVSGHPPRLNSVYNNIVNVYEEYRRDLILNQLHPPHTTTTGGDESSRAGTSDSEVSGPGDTALGVFHPVTDLSQSEQRIRDNEMLFSSYAGRLAQNRRARLTSGAQPNFDRLSRHSFYHSARTFRPSIQSVFGNPREQHSALINPSSDPFLSSTNYSSATDISALSSSTNVNSEGQRHPYGEPNNSAFAPRFLAPPVRGFSSPPPSREPDDESGLVTNIVDSLIRNGLPDRYASVRRGSADEVSTSDSQLVSTACLGISGPQEGTAVRNAVSGSGQATVSLVTSVAAQTRPVPSIFPYLHCQSSTTAPTCSSSQRISKPFQSIRERLQSNTTFTSTGDMSAHSKPDFLSQAKGIPKVTVIMSTAPQTANSSSQAGSSSVSKTASKKSCSTLSLGTIPKVTVLPSGSYRGITELYSNPMFSKGIGACTSTTASTTAAGQATRSTSDLITGGSFIGATSGDRHPVGTSGQCIDQSQLTESARPCVTSVDNSASVITRTSATTSASTLLRDSVLSSGTANVSSESSNELSSESANVLSRESASVLSGGSAGVLSMEDGLAPALTVPGPGGMSGLEGAGPTGLDELIHNYSSEPASVVASTSSHSTLLENIFHRSDTLPEPGTTGLHMSQPGYADLYSGQSHQWQNRTRYMSIMGPYLESRGINPVTNLPSSTVLEESTHDIPVMPLNTPHDFPTANLHSREQASSDTETELSAHLSTSGAYFLPITEDQRRSLSSASVNRNTDSAVLRQFSTSAGSTDSVQGQSSRSSSQGQEIELVVDQNENYTTNRAGSASANDAQNIRLRSHDSNNNSIHIVTSSSENVVVTSGSVQDRNQDYLRLRDSFVSMTDQIEREMIELNRRINALRDSFNQSIRSLRQDRRRYENLDNLVSGDTATNLAQRESTDIVPIPDPRATATDIVRQLNSHSSITGEDGPSVIGVEGPFPVTQPPTLLETSARQVPPSFTQIHSERPGLASEMSDDTHSWRQLHRHYLHPHYSASILDDTINRPNNALQSAINRAIAGAFIGTGEPAVANNIINQTHRIQAWDFTKCHIPDISSSTVNIVVPHCKLHNDASADIAQNDTLLATFVPSHQGFPDDNILAVYSLEHGSRGQCLYTKKFGPNAISVSISPSCNYILVGLAAKRLSWVFASHQMVAQIYKLEKKQAGEKSMKHVKDVMHTCRSEVRTQVSGNSARWLPLPGQGLVYGTNRGDLNLCIPGVKVVVGKGGMCEDALMPWSYFSSPIRVSAGTQTAGVRRTAGTQTEHAANEEEEEHFV